MAELKDAGLWDHAGAEGSKFKSNFSQGSAGFKNAAGFDFPIGNKSGSRLNGANLPIGGIIGQGSLSSQGSAMPQVISKGSPGADDWRVKLSLPPKASGFYNDSPLMAPLKATGGLVWPITPTIILQHSANYTPQELPHTNYPYYAYNNSRVDAMSIIGNFPVQNAMEGAYWLAALHFLRTASKMFYGPGGAQGNPPQVLRLNGYGEHIFKDVSVIIEQVTVELRESVDYITVQSGPPVTKTKELAGNQGKGGSGNRGTQTIKSVPPTRVPTDSVFTVLVQPIYSRKKLKDKFNLKDFANGTLAKDGFI